MVLSVFLICIYLFIPSSIQLKSDIYIKTSRSGLYRMLLNPESVGKWWPGQRVIDSMKGYNLFNGSHYLIGQGDVSLVPVIIKNNQSVTHSSLYLIAPVPDSCQAAWVCEIATSSNPIKRFRTYQNARVLKHDMDIILSKMKAYYSKDENIYGIQIQKELVKDPILISTSALSKEYPTTEFIYSLLDRLSNYATLHTAKETGYPMLNINTEDGINYDTKVAIPIDRVLENSGDISQKRMLGNGNILVAEVKGGITNAALAFEQIQKYADDYQRAAPAIPFYSLVTDRRKEPDTSKWITRIYYPVR